MTHCVAQYRPIIILVKFLGSFLFFSFRVFFKFVIKNLHSPNEKQKNIMAEQPVLIHMCEGLCVWECVFRVSASRSLYLVQRANFILSDVCVHSSGLLRCAANWHCVDPRTAQSDSVRCWQSTRPRTVRRESSTVAVARTPKSAAPSADFGSEAVRRSSVWWMVLDGWVDGIQQ